MKLHMQIFENEFKVRNVYNDKVKDQVTSYFYPQIQTQA